MRQRPKNLVRSIAKARRSGLTVRLADGESDLREFHRLYVATMRGHRSLPRLYRQLRLARRELQPSGVFRLFLVEDAGRPVAGGVFHVLGDTIDLLYNASDYAALAQRPNHLLYQHVINWARARGLTRLDFGFAWPDTPLGAFKAQWGAEAVVEHGYTLGSGTAAPSARPGGAPRLPAVLAPALDALWDRAPTPALRAASMVVYRYL